ncbi:MAG: hypothetical protein F6J94_09995 [Moorea sp. SIO1F2]|nr:hypothetical protein [Moorena sp. SIO1F2]
MRECLLPVPYSLLPAPCSLFPVPCSLCYISNHIRHSLNPLLILLLLI